MMHHEMETCKLVSIKSLVTISIFHNYAPSQVSQLVDPPKFYNVCMPYLVKQETHFSVWVEDITFYVAHKVYVSYGKVSRMLKSVNEDKNMNYNYNFIRDTTQYR